MVESVALTASDSSPSGATIPAPSARYLRYRVTFTTTNPTLTAVLNDVTITWK